MPSTTPALMYFSVGYCPYCRAFAPSWAITTSMLDATRVPVRALEVKCDTDRRMAQAYGVERFPTVILDDGHGRIFKYDGNRLPSDIVMWTRSIVGWQ